MSEHDPGQNQPNPQEKPFLTEQEILALLIRLRSERLMDEETDRELEAMDRDQGYRTADDKFDRDLMEGIAEYFRIDFERLRTMPLADAHLLLEEFYLKAPKKLHPPIPPDLEINLEAYLNTPIKKHIAKWEEDLEKEKPIDLE